MLQEEKVRIVAASNSFLCSFQQLIDIYNACFESQCTIGSRIVKNLAQHVDCIFGCWQHLDIARNRKATIPPCLKAPGKRSNMFKAPPPQRKGHASTMTFTRVGAIKDDLTVDRQIHIPVLPLIPAE